ncbi:MULTISPECIES: hypothetical protein [Oceanospirillaceae]|uniref:Uncharacterized protein n=1 Tax=Oceanobacter antarcticus TaxID=3133425 RepID=A0ABW8NNP6_9GAMM|tara:strand:- start:38 stop:211 length:174 start_codon:yes stop_codon:yes gene_type:complete
MTLSNQADVLEVSALRGLEVDTIVELSRIYAPDINLVRLPASQQSGFTPQERQWLQS